jgi:hypothetical protein
MIVADAPSTGVYVACSYGVPAPPGIVMVALSRVLCNASRTQSKGRAKGLGKARPGALYGPEPRKTPVQRRMVRAFYSPPYSPLSLSAACSSSVASTIRPLSDSSQTTSTRAPNLYAVPP